MKLIIKTFLALLLLITTGCGENNNNPEAVDLENKGIGPVGSLEIEQGINNELATHGEDLFQNKCTACHNMESKFVGPPLAGVTHRRSPEWILNMILDPGTMIKKDPVARKLFEEYNGAVMIDQNLSEDEARALLEYFRSFDR